MCSFLSGFTGRYLPVSLLHESEGWWAGSKTRKCRRSSCEFFSPLQVGQVPNPAWNSVTRVLWWTFVSQLAEAWANMPHCCFSTSKCAWQNSSLWRISRKTAILGWDAVQPPQDPDQLHNLVTLGKVTGAQQGFVMDWIRVHHSFTSAALLLN